MDKDGQTQVERMNNSGMSPTSDAPMETPSDLFKELWARLKECHDMEVQGLQVKINKLKKERCLDAQRLEEFYSKNQQLREHQKALQDNIKVLEDRLRAGLCDRCTVTEEHMMKKQGEFESVRQQNLHLVTELMNERNSLQDENKKLSQEVEQLRILGLPLAPSPYREVAVIPDSPVQQLSLPTVNKMRRKKDNKHVRYTEKPAQLSGRTLPSDDPRMGISSINSLGCGNDVFVAETCEVDVSQLTNNCSERCRGTDVIVVAETCQMEEEEPQNVFRSFTTSGTSQASVDSQDVSLTGNEGQCTSPDFSLDKEWLLQQRISPVFGKSAQPFKHPENSSPSILRNKRLGHQKRLCLSRDSVRRISPLKTFNFNGHTYLNGENTVAPSARDQLTLRQPGRESRKGRQANDRENGDMVEKPLDLSDRVLGGHQNSALCKDTDGQDEPYLKDAICRSLRGQDPHRHTAVFKLPATPHHGKTLTQQLFNIQTPDVQEPIGKKSRFERKDPEQNPVLQFNPCSRMKRSTSQKDGMPAVTDEQSWVLEPDVSLSKYVANSPTRPELGMYRPEGETMDMDCTFVSPSMLLKGLRENGHDDLSTGVGLKANDSLAEIFDKSAYGEYESCPQDEDSDLEQEEPHEEEEDEPLDMSEEKTQTPPNQIVKPQANHNERTNASFAHMEVVRKKEERKKLKGHTCKECEIYYADLPESERQKKLSACSRHRFRYIPPSTPENFWEVGFPSTQTCMQRGPSNLMSEHQLSRTETSTLLRNLMSSHKQPGKSFLPLFVQLKTSPAPNPASVTRVTVCSEDLCPVIRPRGGHIVGRAAPG
ncbi:hypothetical protein SKAU_G00061050 [Synaphobranchus kaupii]|uniref:DNA endonuclease RBBP8 n=1 Tax=Synaphobranchus kaupii TaxID=118154 RepID=A0A9Q1JAR2_SYNKA|nr:hypothetical protein SKAU_G00061050 [Synaphobranchus kaupii]